jgi:hypothetical protein
LAPRDDASREKEKTSDVENAILRRHSTSAFSHSQDPYATAEKNAIPMVGQGLVRNAIQSGRLSQDTRAKLLPTRADVLAFRKGQILPVEFLQTTLAEKVWPQFLRGDHEVGVFQVSRK